MKRLLPFFLALAIVLNLTLAACTVSEPLADVRPTETAAEDTPLAALPQLDGFEAAGGYGMGGGGGGADTIASASIMPREWEPVNVFSGTQFVANVMFPAESGPSPVLQQQPSVMDVAAARQIADQWGFTGPLYLIPQPEAPEGEAGFVVPPTYFVFDGKRTLQLDAQSIYYNDGNLTFDYTNQTPYEQSRAIAESFLQARGLLNFPYEVRQGYYSSEVGFYRLVDGRPVNQSEIWVTVTGDQVASLGYSVLRSATELGNYPLISAEAAWQQLIEKATIDGILLYEVMPANVPTDVYVEEPAVDQPLFWVRAYEAGQEAHMYTWPTIYQSAEGNALPRVETFPLALQANDETLQAVAASGSRMFHFWGTVGADGKSLEVAGWEALDETVNYSLFVEGIIRHEGDQVVVTAFETGETYILNNAPADLPEGLEVSVFAFAVRDAGLAYPLLEWDNISERVVYEEQPIQETSIPVDGPGMWQPFVYSTITIDRVELAYYLTYVHDEEVMRRGEYAPATILLQPVWKFSGTADNGDLMTFHIQAVASEYIQQ